MRSVFAVALLLCAAPPVAAGLSPGAIVEEGMSMAVVVDVDSDGLTDLVQDFDVLVNQGSGNFVKRSLGLQGSDIVVDWLHVNGDRYADLLTRDQPGGAPGGGSSPSKLTYRIYLGGPGFKWTRGPAVPHEGAVPYIAELNGDGKEDIVLSNALHSGALSLGTDLKVLLSNGDGTFTHRSTVRLPNEPQYGVFNRLVVGDLNHDSHRDLVFRTVRDLIVVPGTGGGNLGTPDVRYLPMEPFGFWFTDLADVDRDGNLDVLLARMRTVRVFYGDGRGKFPRLSTSRIAKTHDARIPPHLVIPNLPGHPAVTPDNMQQPRNFAIGRYVREGRFELAVGTGEGDIVVFAYEKGTLIEVDRIETELIGADVHAGSFFDRGRSDLYVTWNFGQLAGRPKPRLLYGDPLAAAPPVTAGRTRAIRGAAHDPSVFDVQIASACETVNETWTLTREGIFGRDQIGDRVIETALAEGLFSFRLTSPALKYPAYAAVPSNGRRYEGTVNMETPCGWTTGVTITATPWP